MTDARLTLEASDARLTVSARDGGRMTSLVVGGHELLVTEGHGPIRWGCYPMAPFAGRIRAGRFSFRGRDLALPRNLPPHAIHGTVFERPWTITGPATLAVDLGPDWPFRGRATQEFELGADGLTARLALEAAEPMPASLGYHPWFRRRLAGTRDRPLPPSAPVKLGVRPGAMYERDSSGLPTGRLIQPSPPPWDDAFVDMAAPPVVRWPGILHLTIHADSGCWVVYDESPDGVCVEPQTAPPDFVHLRDPMPPAWLATADRPARLTMTWSWTVD